MKILLTIMLLCSLTASAGELEFLPMASFLVKVTNPQESTAVWNKIRIYLLTNNYKFVKNQTANEKMYSYPNIDEKITVLIAENLSKGFVEVVYLQERKNGFSEFASNKYHELKLGVQKLIGDKEVVDSVTLKSEKKGN